MVRLKVFDYVSNEGASANYEAVGFINKTL
jgi:hypothetical protein